MERRRDCGIAILVAAAMLFVSGCFRSAPTSPAVVGTHERSTASVGAVTFIVPDASGSIRHFPEMSILDGEGNSGDLYSDYFRTTETNREFRRGFAEFTIPTLTNVFSAKVVLRETRAGIAEPLPPDRHELSYYTDADLFVNTSDFDRPTSPLGVFETDANLPTQKFQVDVSRLVVRLRGARLGFRVKLEADPTYAGMGFLGSGFWRSSTPAGIRIEVTTTPAEANDRLQSLIRRMGLPTRLEASLLIPLRQVGHILRDDDPRNDMAACRWLREFISEVESHEHDRQLSAPQFTDLEELALNILTSLGCSEPAA